MKWRAFLPLWARSYLYARASRKHPGLRGQLMFEWAKTTGNPLPTEERERIRAAHAKRQAAKKSK